MKRLTSNNTFEMDLVQLALNQVYIEDGWAWYQGGVPEHDVSVCDLIRTAADTLLVELPMLSDEDLSGLMADFLQYGEAEPEGVLAILYRALWAMAELRDKLSRYEDTELEPEEILTGEELAEIACAINLLKEYQSIGSVGRFREFAHAEKDGRLVVLPPNDPLTLEELREMDGEPVWCINGNGGQWGLVHVFSAEGETYVECVTKTGFTMDDMTYGAMGIYAWLAYRRKPEEGDEMKCDNCKKHSDCASGSGFTWPCGAYVPLATSNADRIRGMSDQQLVRLIVHTTADGCPPDMDWECAKDFSSWEGCENCWAKWLERPAREAAP